MLENAQISWESFLDWFTPKAIILAIALTIALVIANIVSQHDVAARARLSVDAYHAALESISEEEAVVESIDRCLSNPDEHNRSYGSWPMWDSRERQRAASMLLRNCLSGHVLSSGTVREMNHRLAMVNDIVRFAEISAH